MEGAADGAGAGAAAGAADGAAEGAADGALEGAAEISATGAAELVLALAGDTLTGGALVGRTPLRAARAELLARRVLLAGPRPEELIGTLTVRWCTIGFTSFSAFRQLSVPRQLGLRA